MSKNQTKTISKTKTKAKTKKTVVHKVHKNKDVERKQHKSTQQNTPRSQIKKTQRKTQTKKQKKVRDNKTSTQKEPTQLSFENLVAVTNGHNGINFFNSITGEFYFSISQNMEFIERFIVDLKNNRVIIGGGEYDDNMAVTVEIYVYNILTKKIEEIYKNTEEYFENLDLDENNNTLYYSGHKNYKINLSTKKVEELKQKPKNLPKLIESKFAEDTNQSYAPKEFKNENLNLNFKLEKDSIVIEEKGKINNKIDISKFDDNKNNTKKNKENNRDLVHIIFSEDNLLIYSTTHSSHILTFLIEKKENGILN